MLRNRLGKVLLSVTASKSKNIERGLNGVHIRCGLATVPDDIDLGTSEERETMHFDLLVAGAGPAGLSAAIKFKQLCQEKGKELSVCVIEKGAEVGAHILSGNVFEPRALDELVPDWRDDPDCPIHRVPAKTDKFYFLTRSHSIRLPTPPQMRNKGNYVVSLSETVRWLASRAEGLGVEMYPGFAGNKVMYTPDGSAVKGIVTNDMGIAKDGSRKDNFTLGMALTAGATLFAEGCRGSLTQEVCKHFELREKAGSCPQTYALGMKEVWEIDAEKHKPGMIWHGVGWPLPWDTYGGMWLYHWDLNRVSLGLVVALDYKNPHLNLYEEFQQLKRHPAIGKLLEGGTCLQYGARTLVEGGLQSLPQTGFAGGALIGDSAGLLNVPKIKGTHTAMKSGIIAAEHAFQQLSLHGSGRPIDLTAYDSALRESWVGDELTKVRNIRPSFNLGGGIIGGVTYSALDTYLLRGNAPWTFRHRQEDHEALRPISEMPERKYPNKYDGKITFDLATSLFRSGTNHDHDQPAHLRLRNPKMPEVVNLGIYGGPEAKYCPAGVYEYTKGEDNKEHLAINAQNCLHCKACDIKDPRQNIHWTVPEGGGGPSYTVM